MLSKLKKLNLSLLKSIRLLVWVLVFVSGLWVRAGVPIVKKPFDASLLTSFSYSTSAKSLDIVQAYGAAFTFRNLYMFGETKFSMHSDFFTESWKTQEGAFSVGVERMTLREWAVLTNPAAVDLLMGIGLGIGVAQSTVKTKIQDESFKAYGNWEPLWGLMVNGQYEVENQLMSNLFVELALKKIFANNFAKGERAEVDLAVGVRF